MVRTKIRFQMAAGDGLSCLGASSFPLRRSVGGTCFPLVRQLEAKVCLLIPEPASPRASLVSDTVSCCFHAELLNPVCSPDPVQVWGVTEEYFREHMFPGTPDSVLTTLGSMSCLVSIAAPRTLWFLSPVPTQPAAQIMTIVGIVAGKLADR